MTIQDLLKYCDIRVNYLNNLRDSYIKLGDFIQVAKIENEISQTQQTIDSIKSLI
jgi:hypothetical protein